MTIDSRIRVATSILKWAVVFLICKVTYNILSNYPGYFPPDFNVDFLLGRKAYFFGAYQVAFYTHIVSTPAVLLSGPFLLSERFRRRFPTWHRLIGRCHVAIVLICVVPSGLWMSAYAYTGLAAGLGFATLALSTGFCAAMGWRLARQRRFNKHRQWMTRCYLLLCSAVLLRLFSGAATLANLDPEWTYRIAAWLCWLVPILCFELLLRRNRFASSFTRSW